MFNNTAYTSWLEEIAGWLALCAPIRAGAHPTTGVSVPTGVYSTIPDLNATQQQKANGDASSSWKGARLFPIDKRPPAPFQKDRLSHTQFDASFERAIDVVQQWEADVWPQIEELVFMHGIGPYLHYNLPATPLYTALPPSFRTWLAEQYRMNEARVNRMHEELAAILEAAQRHGIAVMPLKGSILSLCHYARPALRPMADLDLLVQPADFAPMSRLLQEMGYRLRETYSPQKATFQQPGATRVVSYTTEHPDNPRDVELLSQIERAIWYKPSMHEQPLDLFADSQAGELLGYPVRVASTEASLWLYATHLGKHLLVRTARLIQLIDLALVLTTPVTRALTLPDAWADWIYPPLLTLQQVLPQPALQHELARLATVVHPRIYRWCTRTPTLAARGMVLIPNLPHQFETSWLSASRIRWNVWRLDPWRMTLAYGDSPWPVAYTRYLQQVSKRAWYKLWHPAHPEKAS